jgi:alpha-methylacyl-CoA racemase
MYWALGEGIATGQWPGNSGSLVTGATARYRLYPTRDGQVVAAAPIEHKFWRNFCGVIGIEPQYADDKDSAAASARVAEIIRGKDAVYWENRFREQDCCCTVVKSAREAVTDPQFVARGLFAHMLINTQGQVIPALPVPVNDAFRASSDTPVPAPTLGAHNVDYIK